MPLKMVKSIIGSQPPKVYWECSCVCLLEEGRRGLGE